MVPLAHLRMTIVAPGAGRVVVMQSVRSALLRLPLTQKLPNVFIAIKSLIYGRSLGHRLNTKPQDLVTP